MHVKLFSVGSYGLGVRDNWPFIQHWIQSLADCTIPAVCDIIIYKNYYRREWF